ncbi:hypothetical protein F0L74_00765 [Chitinophaga agrisoli]|uniref:Uncharacterized protein n=1 Tax=Chitinophaga agrisoli TaxID=2607653 RepID=A0A5B2W1J3_9BACT|nr:hypothetical protein [Chitinophaga agrisoli]KAA2244542.1 hypothetical protein F0L74_00765 [Chitinophaga agrisoli]
MTHELIRKFFCNQCTAAEANAVVAYFREFPDALEVYLNDEEWQSFTPAGEPLPAVADKMLLEIEKWVVPHNNNRPSCLPETEEPLSCEDPEPGLAG